MVVCENPSNWADCEICLAPKTMPGSCHCLNHLSFPFWHSVWSSWHSVWSSRDCLDQDHTPKWVNNNSRFGTTWGQVTNDLYIGLNWFILFTGNKILLRKKYNLLNLTAGTKYHANEWKMYVLYFLYTLCLPLLLAVTLSLSLSPWFLPCFYVSFE